ELDILVLQPAQPLVGIGDVVESLDHLGLELGLDGGKRERVLHVVVVEIGLAGRSLAALAVLPVAALGCSLERGRRRGRGRGSGAAGVGASAGPPGPACVPAIGCPSGPITGAGMALASGPA